MHLVRLLRRNLLQRPLRSALTIGSLAVALFLLSSLRALVDSLESGVRGAATNRLIVESSVSLFIQLPISYQPDIESVAGVATVCKWTWFGAFYQDESNFFAQFATDPEHLLDMYPEIELVQGTAQAFQQDRRSCVIGEQLAREFDWKLGDTIPLIGALYPRKDGAAWEFEVAGIYRARMPVDNRTLFFHYDYLREAGEAGLTDFPPTTGLFAIRVADGADAEHIMRTIDERFAQGPQRTLTTTDAEFNRQFVTMIGNIPTLLGAIGAAVLFAVVVATVNTMLMAARERTRDLGILKALGFPDRTAFALLIAESLTLSFLGGLLGIALALLVERPVHDLLEMQLFPGYEISAFWIGAALLLAVAIGLVAGIVPAWQAGRLRTVDALRQEG
jgi:putative ABC transport system permease protein